MTATLKESRTVDPRPSLAELREAARNTSLYCLQRAELNTLLDIAEAAQAVVAEGVEVGDGCIESKGADMHRLEAALAKVRA